MKKTLLICLIGLITLNLGCSSTDDSSDSVSIGLEITAGDSSTVISFDSGDYNLLYIDQDYSILNVDIE